MSALFVLTLGVIIVVGGILVLRLHAFIALVLAALVVAMLTPQMAFVRQAVINQAAKRGIQIQSVFTAGNVIELSVPQGVKLGRGTELLAIRLGRDPWKLAQSVKLTVVDVQPRTSSSDPLTVVARVAGDQSVFPALGDLVVFVQDFHDASAAAAKISPPEQVAAGFGNTAAGIGILIALASIVGKCVLESGAADRVVRSAMRVTGEAGAPAAFVGSGFLLGIPVFFDTVFYLMIPLGKALRLRTGRNYLLYVLAIVAGATMAHSLVPPTPGPLLVAAELGVNMGLMMLVGSVVGGCAALAGYVYAMAISRRVELPLRESDEAQLQLSSTGEMKDHDLPPLWLSLMPIVLPVVLIGGAELLTALEESWESEPFSIPPGAMHAIGLLGNKNVALLVAAAVAVGTLVWKRRLGRDQLAKSLQPALAGAGVIILITSAGGAFGKVTQQTGVATLIDQLPVQSTAAILTLGFMITAAVRTAQGSATVAMITAVGILGPLAASGQLNFHPVWLAVAIGCGSKVIAWMNDSGFWVITQMSGMTEVEGLKYVTTMLLVMSLVGLAVTILGAMSFPMV